MIHDLKIQLCFADAILRGYKNFEVRYNADRGFQKGDLINFFVLEKDTIVYEHPLNKIPFVVTYVLSGFGLKEDHVAFGIKRWEAEE